MKRVMNCIAIPVDGGAASKTGKLFSAAMLISSVIVLLSISLEGYADTDECANSNPYLQQTCQQMKQAADATKQANDQAYQKAAEQGTKQEEKNIAQSNQPPAPSPPPLPAWQQAITPSSSTQAQTGAAGSTTTQATGGTTADNSGTQGATATQDQTQAPPPPGPAELAGPAPIKGPGALTIIPVKKPDSGGPAMYY